MERKVKYNYEFKLRCVEEVLKNRSLSTIAKENGIALTGLNVWIRCYHKFENAGLLPLQKTQITVQTLS